ncbi:glutamate receptor ionotropic, NMDA 3A-like [Ptychodera flava]|uniref:glutamate receptor ionotropic, NMDA 3A-like n=1 Tax=Ptychodera flava TaxID=63121 RepID=UPI00396A9CA6
MANDPECRLINVGKTFGEEGYGIGLPKGSPLKETLSIFILEYETDGYLEELQQKWFGTMNCYKESNIKSSSGIGDHKVRLAHVAGLFLMLLMGFGIGFLILLLEHLVYHYGVPRMQLHPEHKRNWLVLSQRLHRAANTEELIPCKANMQEVITLFKKGQFTKMFQREQLRRKSMLRKDSAYDLESTTTFKDLIDSIAWEQRRSSGPFNNDRRSRDTNLNKKSEAKETIMMQNLDKPPHRKDIRRRLSDVGSDSDTSYDNLQRFSPTGELVRFSPHGDVISQSLSDSLNNLDQLDNQMWKLSDQNSGASLHSSGDQDNQVPQNFDGNSHSDQEFKNRRPKMDSTVDSAQHGGVNFADSSCPSRQNGRAKFATWTDDDDEEDMFDQEPTETHPMMMDEDLSHYQGSYRVPPRYANSSMKLPHSDENYHNPYSYDPYDPSVFDPQRLSKGELLLRWRLSQREMTKRLGRALNEKAKLEMKVSELEAQLDDR